MLKLLIVDSSAQVRHTLGILLAGERELQLLGTAIGVQAASEKVRQLKPQLVLLDLDLPQPGCEQFIRQLQALSVLVIGLSGTLHTAPPGVRCVLSKPGRAEADDLAQYQAGLLGALRAASHALPRASPPHAAELVRAGNASQTSRGSGQQSYVQEKLNTPKIGADAILSAPVAGCLQQQTERVVVIGVSTGGTQALEVLLPALSTHCPGLLIVQHMPEKFTTTFAARLNEHCQIEVKEAESGDKVVPGRALIAPGGKHLLLKRQGGRYLAEVIDGPLVCRHRPSADVLFRSAAKFAGKNAIGIIMTGMGDDGAIGLKEMHDVGAATIAQDEKSCVVFGMPKEAIKLGAVDEVLSLDKIAAAIMRHVV